MKRCAACRRVYDRDVRVCEVDGTLLDDFSSDSLIGHTIAKRYRLIRRLGTGPLARVYLAAELRTGRPVAVKLLDPEYRCDDDVLKQCLWDARFATASSPAHVARVYEVGRTDEGQIFVAMEYVDGECLADLIQRAGPLEPERALRLAGQIAQALTAAARVGVAHRDIKPQNVMVDGADDRVTVTDFGVAWLRARGERGSPARFGGDAPKYAAPEQWRGEDADDRTDIYGIGAVLYAMLTGAAPPAQRHDAAGGDAGWVAPPPVTSRRPELPGALDDTLVRAMAREPDRRYDSIGEFAARLGDLTTALVEGGTPEGAREPATASPRIVIEPVSEPSYLAPWRSWFEWWQPHHEQWRAQLDRQRAQLRLNRARWQTTVPAHWRSSLRLSRAHMTGVKGALAQTAAGASRTARGAIRTAAVGVAAGMSRAAFVASATASRAVECTSRAARLASRATARSVADAGGAAARASVRASRSLARAAVNLSYASAGLPSATAARAVSVSARAGCVVSTRTARSASAVSRGVIGMTRRGRRSVARGAGTIVGAVAAGARVVPAASRAAVSGVANTSRTVACGAVTISRAATNAAATAIVGTAGTIASATAAATNAVRGAARSTRSYVDKGLQAFATSATGASRAAVSGIATTSRMVAHGMATMSLVATSATATAIAGSAGTIASAAAAVTNAARNARPHVDRGLQALATSVTGASRIVVMVAGTAAGASATASRVALMLGHRAACEAASVSQAAGHRAIDASRALADVMTRASSVAAAAAQATTAGVATASRAAATVVTTAAAGAATAVSGTIPAGPRALRRVVDGSGVAVAASGAAALESRAIARRVGTLASRRGDQALRWARAHGRRLAVTSATTLIVVGAIMWGIVGRHRDGAADRPSVASRVVAPRPEIAREPGPLERASRAPTTPRPPGRALARADDQAGSHAVTVVTTADHREKIAPVPRSEPVARGPSETERSVEVPTVRTVGGADDADRVRLEIQQTLRSRGLLRESVADRWGVTVDVSPSGDVMLEGAVRDVALSQEAVRRAQDVAKARHVSHNIRVIAGGDAP